ncbi:hypothetical protein HDU80_000892 [Chytriomyces hyalinus]|nr:hypothetical protein HDU80_000892 [Chytriomyces hyalinus]
MSPLPSWEKYFEELEEPADQTLKDVQAVIKLTMPAFAKGFEDNQAPLNNASMLECEFLNRFIHPVFEKCVHKFGNKSRWMSGEVHHKFFVENTKGDGVAVLNGWDNLPVAYFEGLRPFASLLKKSADSAKVQMNCVAILQETILHLSMAKK